MYAFKSSFIWKLSFVFVVALSLSCLSGAWSFLEAQETETKPSYKQYAPGLLRKLVFRAEKQDDRPGVEVWSLLVGPGMKTGVTELPGGAILLVRSGEGAIAFSGQLEELKLGQTMQIEPGTSFQISNTNDVIPINIRAVVILR